MQVTSSAAARPMPATVVTANKNKIETDPPHRFALTTAVAAGICVQVGGGSQWPRRSLPPRFAMP